MSTFLFNEGKKIILDVLLKSDLTNKGSQLQIGLFTNAGLASAIKALTLSAITEPTGGDYARKSLLNANWDTATLLGSGQYAKQIFTPTTTDITETIYGWFICTTGTTGYLLFGGKFDDMPNGYNGLVIGNSISYTPHIIV